MRQPSELGLEERPNSRGDVQGTGKLFCAVYPQPRSGRLCRNAAHTQPSQMLAMGGRQLCAFEHQHHPYFRGAAGEFWLPAGASWQVRPACQARCQNRNRYDTRGKGGKCCPALPHAAAYLQLQCRTMDFLLLLNIQCRCYLPVIYRSDWQVKSGTCS